jgi:4-amino-4-deoxy-L-arabinose transferase-like glycosyltransferase
LASRWPRIWRRPFQALAGHRLIGEFLRQWLFIVGGMVVAYRLGLALSRSVGATLTVLAMALVVLASAPTYHHDKLFFFPLMIWVGWRYLDKPDAQGAWLLGAVTALGFLFRHDYGIYLGFGTCTALVLARYTQPASRTLRAIRNDLFACALAVAIIVAPWALWVQTTEGLLEYTRMRMALSQRPDKPVYASLLTRNALRTLIPERPDPMPAVVGFLWQPAVDERQQRALEQQFRLRRMVKEDSGGRLLYEVPNAYDIGLLGLDPYIMDGVGFQWDRLRDLQAGLPSRDNVTLWLQHVALVVPLVLIGTGGARLWRSRRTGAPVDPDDARMLLAGTFLVVVNSGILREPSYVVVVVPAVAALSARFVVSRSAAVRLCAIGVLAATTFAVLVRERGSLLLHPSRYRASVSAGLDALLATPGDVRNPYRYLHECTAPGDRLLITGITPSYLSYYAQRPFAGGHIAWHQGWRSDPEHEAQLLARLERQ